MERNDVREHLERNNLSFVWLINRLADKGIAVDKTEMSSMIAGTRKGPKAESVIRESIIILDDYEKKFSYAAE